MVNPFVAIAVDVLLRTERPLVEYHLGPLIDHRAGIAGERHSVLLALEEILPHFGADFFEEKAQMRRDWIVAQHRVALLRQIANAEQRARAKDHQWNDDQVEHLVSDDADAKEQRCHHGAYRENDETR